jgi:uncharacterized protein (TIGR03086 family)
MSSAERAYAGLPSGVDLLAQAIGYTLGTLPYVTDHTLSRPSPCGDWDLRVLLSHMTDSFTALEEAAQTGDVSLTAAAAAPWDVPYEPVAGLRHRALAVLDAWSEGDQLVTISGLTVPAEVVASTGAVEVAVHGWDVAQACGRPQPIPASLGRALLAIVPLLVSAADRPARFAAPYRASALASPGDRLVAYLGRRP